MNEALERALTFIAEAEGGEVNDPRDPGGRTRYGISARGHPEVDLDTLTPEGARAIMARDYWYKPGLGRLPEAVAMVMMDTAVQTGPARAVRFLQRAHNALASGPALKVDGVLGPKTASAVNNWCGPEWTVRTRLMALDLLFRRAEYFARLAAQANQAAFLRGRLMRTARLWRLVSGARSWPNPA